MKWACVPVIDDIKEVMRIIYRLFTCKGSMDLTTDDLQNGIRDSVKNHKFLLVLDDVWEESRERWLPLLSLLECGEKSSMIIVTTRSGVVASVIGTVSEYSLGLLSQEESWKLFKGLAFRPGQEESNPNFTDIGKDIIKKCGNVPLAIRTIGSLLYSKDSEQEWLLIKDSNLLESELLDGSSISVMHVLRLSYDYLASPLKKCFAYCSLFTKDYEFDMAELVPLWMAQGYIETPLNENLSLEDVGDLYFHELLRRNFFQIGQQKHTFTGYKMHDIMHDLSQLVAKDTLECDLVSLREFPSSLEAESKVRTIILNDQDDASRYKMISKFPSLRVLKVKRKHDELLDSFKRLRHLRYLSFTVHSRRLPNYIPKLDNLQTLELGRCNFLTELPRGLTKLTNLRHLGIRDCPLTDLPPGFGNMKSLRELDKFVVGKSNGLDSLAEMNLKGNLDIKICSFRENGILEANKLNLKDKQQLVVPNLVVHRVKGKVVMTRGCLMFIPKLVSITVAFCYTCQQLPEFHLLPNLKKLCLQGLAVLEYVEDDVRVVHGGSSCCAAYFPSLQELELLEMPELKWWSKVKVPPFPCLSQLSITYCPKLMSMPEMSRLEDMSVSRIGEPKLLRSIVEGHHSLVPAKSEAWRIGLIHSASSWSMEVPNTETLDIGGLTQMIGLHVEAPNYFLRKLSIHRCRALRNIWNGLQRLPVLEELYIEGCEELDLWELNYQPPDASNILRRLTVSLISKLEAIPSSICDFFTKLEFLEIGSLDNLKSLPEQIGQLSYLCDLRIYNCPKLESLPQSLAGLTSLGCLEIRGSPLLETRCRQPNASTGTYSTHS